MRLHHFILGFLALSACIGYLIYAPNKPNYYYSGRIGYERGTTVSCAYAHWEWRVDEVVFCSDDRNKVVEFVTKANSK